jgi:hypothetical protein
LKKFKPKVSIFGRENWNKSVAAVSITNQATLVTGIKAKHLLLKTKEKSLETLYLDKKYLKRLFV